MGRTEPARGLREVEAFWRDYLSGFRGVQTGFTHVVEGDGGAVLEWVEAVTLIADTHAPRESFEGLKAHFSEEEIGWLTLAATLINTWNRIAISSRAQYDRAQVQHAAGQSKVAEPA